MRKRTDDDDERRPKNREKKLAPRKARNWCPACDGAIVSDGSICPGCGTRKLPRRFKK